MWQRIKLVFKRISTLEYAPRYSRLAGEISSFEPLLHKRIIETDGKEDQWALQSLALLEQAKIYLRELKIDEGWKSFHAAKRLEIFGMNKHERLALARSVCKETNKLSDWRRDAVITLLSGKKEEVSEAPDAEILAHAIELKDDYYNNQYYTNRLARSLASLLFILLFLVIGSIVFYFSVYSDSCSGEIPTSLNMTGYLIGVLLFGILGALTSAILFTRTLSKSSRINELSTSRLLVISKIFIGAGFSIFIFLILRSSVAQHISLFSFSLSTPIDYFTLAFVSGFTERLAQRSIDLIIGQEKQEKTRSAGSESNG